MNDLIESVANIKKNGSDGLKAARLKSEVCGRGLKHRVFDNRHDLPEEAADVATRARPYVPTLVETARLYGITTVELREHLKQRAAVHDHDLIGDFLDAWDQLSKSARAQAVKERLDEIWPDHFPFGPLRDWSGEGAASCRPPSCMSFARHHEHVPDIRRDLRGP